MPRKRRIPKLRATPLRWEDFDLRDQLCLFVAWSPPTCEFECSRSTWANWAEYLDDYEQVRDVVLAEAADDAREGRRPAGRPVFAEQARSIARRYGLDALDEVSYESIRDYPGDGDDDA